MSRFLRTVPDGDDRERRVCADCGFIDYENPRIVVGSVATWEDRILVCKRAIEPRRGFWTLPAGYLEHGEGAPDGARREAREEACADIAIDRLLGVYSVPHIGQVQLMFAAHLVSGDIAVGPESQEVRLATLDEIAELDLAFPSVERALARFRAGAQEPEVATLTPPPWDTRGR